MTNLSVNLNAVAYVRNRRNLPWPSVTDIARLCLGAGADGITVHPRPDERHIRKTDVFELLDLLRDEWPDRELNIEGYPDEAFLKLCELVKPDQVTLVPDDPEQSTSDHGWDIAGHDTMLAEIIERLQNGAMRVSLFVNPDPAVPAMAADVGADRIELFTGPYGDPHGDAAAYLARLKATANVARKAGLRAARGGAGLGDREVDLPRPWRFDRLAQRAGLRQQLHGADPPGHGGKQNGRRECRGGRFGYVRPLTRTDSSGCW